MIILYAGTQTLGSYFVSAATSSAVWQTALTTMGAAPGALYTAVSLMKNDLPNFYSSIKYHVQDITYKLGGLYAEQTPEATDNHERLHYYHDFHAKLTAQLEANFRDLVLHARTVDTRGQKKEQALPFLYRHTMPVIPPTFAEKAVNIAAHIQGTLLSTMLNGNFFITTLSSLETYIPKSNISNRNKRRADVIWHLRQYEKC